MSEKLPDALEKELKAWRSDGTFSVHEWIGCIGNFDLAFAYTTIFWPKFEIVGDYILTAGNWTPETLKGFEEQKGATPRSVEWVINHVHIVDIHVSSEVEPTIEHVLHIGHTLKEKYAAKLLMEFPDRPCEVEFYIPEDADDLLEYQVSFWQKKWCSGR